MKIIKKDIVYANEEIIVHQVNCQGVMNSGVAKSIRQAFPLNYLLYSEKVSKFSIRKAELLGQTLFTYEKGKIIANIFSQ